MGEKTRNICKLIPWIAIVILTSFELSSQSGMSFNTSRNGVPLPVIENWSSGSFGTLWIPGNNWVVNGQIGNIEPCAEFKWDPILTNYFEALTSDEINGIFPGTKNNSYIDGRFVLEFDLQLDNVNPTGDEKFSAEVWSDSSWHIVRTFNNFNGSFAWVHQEVDITDIAFGKIFKIRFVAHGEVSSDILSWFVDNIKVERVCDPPEDLFVEAVDPNTMELYWSPPYTVNNNEWIHWDDGVMVGGIGLTGGGVFSVASRWDADSITQYNGMFIVKIRFAVYSNASTTDVTLKIWKGQSAGTLLYEEVLSGLTFGDWNEITLSTPVAIDVNQELWFGYTCDSQDGDFPAGYDAGPGVPGYGDMITLDGVVWDPISSFGSQFNLNWNIQAEISSCTDGATIPLSYPEDLSIYRTPDAKLSIENTETCYVPVGVSQQLITGYHVYFNDDGAGYEYIGMTQDTFYTHIDEDQFLYGSLYCYYVKAVYEDCDANSNEACWLTTTGISTADDNSILIFPNPANDKISIQSSTPISQLFLFDRSGRMLQSHNLRNQSLFTLDVSHLEPGIYLLRIDTDEGQVVRKLVID